MSLLEVDQLQVAFGGVAALDSISFEVEAGELLGVIGPNGAGKTTCIETITGYLPQATGRVTFDGIDLGGLPPHRRARLGLMRTFQAVELFDDLTVRENLLAAANHRTWCQSLGDLVAPRRHADRSIVDDTLDLLGIAGSADGLPSELSLGQRKLAGVARALAGRPRLLLLDEPAAGLDNAESLALGERLRAVVDSGVSLLLVDHDMGLVLGACDRIVVLDFGRVLAEGRPEQIRQDHRVIAAYLGNEAVTGEEMSAS